MTPAAWAEAAEALASRLLVVARPADVAAAFELWRTMPDEGLDNDWRRLGEALRRWSLETAEHPLPRFRGEGALTLALEQRPVEAIGWQRRYA